jgi:glucose-6-phosphate 1-dehydrogenase
MAAADGTEPAYTEQDPTVPDDSVTPTFASMILWINNPRWDGVPFVIKAGKALNERKAEIRIQFKSAPSAKGMFADQEIPQNELVVRLQPDEAVYMKTNVKSSGLTTKPVTSELDLSYKEQYNDVEISDAYTRLILEVIRGRQATFVWRRGAQASWAICTPLLHQIEREKVKPVLYEYGSRGPPESDALIEKVRFHYHGGT